MKSPAYQCDICYRTLQCHIEDGEVWNGVGLRHSTFPADEPTFKRVDVRLADHHICGRCLSGLRAFLKETTCSESDTGNSP